VTAVRLRRAELARTAAGAGPDRDGFHPYRWRSCCATGRDAEADERDASTAGRAARAARTARRMLFAAARARGETVRSAAREVGIHPDTGYRWDREQRKAAAP